MKFNIIFIYVFIWTICLFFSLMAIFWPSYNLNPIMLIQESLNSYPLINFKLDNNYYDTIENTKILGPFLKWPGMEIKNDNLYKLISKPQYLYKIYGKYFYYEKYQTYEELLNNGNIIKNHENCEIGLRSCGIIDSLNQKLCLPNHIKCPLNDIEIVKKNNFTIINKYKNEGYNDTKGSDDIIFFYTNNQREKPIIGRIILNGEKPCANPVEFSWKKLNEYERNHSSKCKNKYKGNLYDETYEQFGKITYDTLYKDNLIAQDYDIFYRKLLENNYLYLFKKEFIGIDKECLKLSNIKNIHNSDIIIDYFIFFRLLSIMLGGVNFICIIMVLIYDLFINKNDKKGKNCFNILENVCIIPNFGALIFNTVGLIVFFSITPNFNCSDEVINNKIYLLNKQILGFKITSIGYNIFSIIFLIIALSRKCYHLINKRNNIDSLSQKKVGEEITDLPIEFLDENENCNKTETELSQPIYRTSL